jgi:hypothetical protein
MAWQPAEDPPARTAEHHGRRIGGPRWRQTGRSHNEYKPTRIENMWQLQARPRHIVTLRTSGRGKTPSRPTPHRSVARPWPRSVRTCQNPAEIAEWNQPVNTAIAKRRLQNQCITRAKCREPADVVAWLGAVQAQEYAAARWALALRMPDDTADAEIERAVDEGRILRTHVMRPTWHFVTPADVRWLLELTAPRVHRATASYRRQLGLDTATLTRATASFERALRDGEHLTRSELGVQLGRSGLLAKGFRLALLTMYAELEGVICSGHRRGKQFTYALLAERAPRPVLSRDEALAELTRRYFTSHGPATIRDFLWWSGLTTADAKRGLEMNRARHEVIEGKAYWSLGGTTAGVTRRTVHLLPVYDEYLVAYRDRDAVPHGPPAIKSRVRGTMTFQHSLVIDGQVAGTWKPVRNARELIVDVIPLRRLTGPERRALAETAARYGRFLDVPVSLSVA